MNILIGHADRAIHQAENLTIASIRVSSKHRATAIYSGNLPIRKSVEITMFGNWVKHPKYGKQFKVERFEKTKRGRRHV